MQDAEHYKAYEVSESGRSPSWLGSAEAEARLAQFGPTVLPHARGPGRIARFVSQFNHPLIYVLLGAALVTGMLGETFDAAVILGVVLVNAIVGFIQESRADAALAALAQLTRSNARLIRDGVPLTVASTSVVPGDLVVLEAGDRVPADLHLMKANEMTVGESMLTGESVPVGTQPVPPLRERRGQPRRS